VRFVANVSKIGRRQEEQRNLNENSNWIWVLKWIKFNN
jgi:hypothetical protein